MTFPSPDKVARLLREADADYNLRRRHPEREATYQEYAERSRKFRNHGSHRSYRYAEGARCAIDWFAAESQPGAASPLLVFFHGGFWRSGDKEIFSFIAEPFISTGVSVALVGYELAPAVRVTDIVDQCRRALCWVFDEAEALKIDPSRVTLSGHSAGAHIAALLGAEPLGSFEGSSVAAVIGLSGLYSLHVYLLSSVNLETRMTLDEADRLSPFTRQSFGATQFLIAVGALETDGFIQQSSHFHQHLEDAGVRSSLIVSPEHTHFSIFRDIADPAAILHRNMLDVVVNAKAPTSWCKEESR